MHSLTDVRTLASRANKDNDIGDAIHCLLIGHHTGSPAASFMSADLQGFQTFRFVLPLPRSERMHVLSFQIGKYAW
jgi:hypothetical protein